MSTVDALYDDIVKLFDGKTTKRLKVILAEHLSPLEEKIKTLDEFVLARKQHLKELSTSDIINGAGPFERTALSGRRLEWAIEMFKRSWGEDAVTALDTSSVEEEAGVKCQQVIL